MSVIRENSKFSGGVRSSEHSQSSHYSSSYEKMSGRRSSLRPSHHGRGNVEDLVGGASAAMKRMEKHEYAQERMKMEEKEDNIRDKYLQGDLTEEEAQKLMARGKMHNKDEEVGGTRIDESAAAGADYATTAAMIEDVLDNEDKNYFVRWIKRVTGWTRLMKAAARERSKRQRPDYNHRFACIEKIVHGKAMRVEAGMSKDKDAEGSAFELCLGVILMVNGVLIGIQSSMDSGEDIMAFIVMEHIFTAVFTFELIMRLLSDGWIWLVEGLNFCDFLLIVVTGIIPMWIFRPLGIESNELRILQVLRVLRLIKIVRMVRTVPMFRIFWSLIRGLLDSGRTLLWTYIMIGAVLYIFSIFGVYLIGKDEVFQNSGDEEAAEIALEYFGDVPKTFITLFQTMTLDSWTQIARPLMRHSDIVAPYFILIILMVVLALGNLVTAVIIDNANEAGVKDQELKASEKREEMLKEINELRDIFADIDTDGSGKLSKEEYMEALRINERVQQKFEILGISKEERGEVFDLLDVGSKEVTVDQFANGLRDMQGDAKAKDSFTICKKIGHLNRRLNDLSTKLKRQQTIADELRIEIAEAHRQMGGMLLDLRQVMSYLTYCMPPEEVKRSQLDMEAHFAKLDKVLEKRKVAIFLEEQNQKKSRATEMTNDDKVSRATSKRTLAPKSVRYQEDNNVVKIESNL